MDKSKAPIVINLPGPYAVMHTIGILFLIAGPVVWLWTGDWALAGKVSATGFYTLLILFLYRKLYIAR